MITGVSERGSETEIKYWIQPRRVQPVQLKSKSAKEEMLEYFIAHVRLFYFIQLMADFLVGRGISNRHHCLHRGLSVLECAAYHSLGLGMD
jgi:hypothetical protein